MIKKNKNSDKFLLTANEILNHIGGKNNFSELYNCVTRIRFKIIDKEKVKLEVVKKIPLVKGVVWNGDELQIIIGADVEKVKTALDKIIQNSNSGSTTQLIKTPIYRKLLNFVIAVVVPCLPLMFYTGLSSGISALLSSPGIGLTQSGWGKPLGELDLFSAFLFLNERVGFMLLGVFFGFNTVKYFNGDLILGLLVSLTLSSGLLMGQSWVLIENIFGTGQELAIKGYDGSILIFIFASIAFVYMHRWVKTWMPSVISSMFTPIVSVGVILAGSFFLMGPIISLIELMIATAVLQLLDIPWGIGAFLIALLFQPLVLTGSHMALSSIVLSSMITLEQPSVYYVCVQISAFAQAGAVLGCGIMAKEKSFKANALSTFPITGIFGITEPALYAVNLPKLKPFLAGCVASGSMGLVAGAMGLKMKSYTGNGIFGFLGFEKLTDGAIFLVLGAIALILATVFTCLVYSERKDEYKTYKYFTKRINKLAGEKKLNNLVEKLELVEEYKNENKKLEIEFLKLQSLKNKVTKLKTRNKSVDNDLTTQISDLEKIITDKIKTYNKQLEVITNYISVEIEKDSEVIGNKKDYIQKEMTNAISSLKNNYSTFFEAEVVV
ncbi:PTS transporter subunit EIIC [Spiroplasma diminutum]|uniref:PTS system beta-glucoside-specific transporter subunit IIABC n=1 Tax=Spiroplasma diminutum CUAS-1 TaxID=1276221 RepID=S5MJY9_9MOLU|nr:PTS transporter subunit EIIC [Spiroplasma diminutum]AGR42275.1 PTS system beta-glucoside-specific transporter subunit IIABC [Spiroplasma diminutum CUAS-1]